MIVPSRFLLIAGFAALAAASSGASAALVTLVGSTFNVVYDTTATGDFGTPALSGDYLYFTPNGFSAQSVNGAGLVQTNSLASGIELVADPGYQFSAVAITELGDYLMSGAQSTTSVSGAITIFDPSNAASTQTAAALVLSPTTPMTLDDGVAHNWLASGSVDATTPLAPPLSGSATWLSGAGTVGVSLQTMLSASTAPGSGPQQAFVEEKFAGVALDVGTVSSVPLPAGAPLFAGGLTALGLAALARRPRPPADRQAIKTFVCATGDPT